MAATLRVDPAQLRGAATAQADVSTFVAGMGVGQSMAGARSAMSGLLTEGACQLAGTIFDAAASAVRDELTAHSVNLSTAADRYQRMDEDLGRSLRTLTQ
jgi:hypothetical protein